MSFKLVSKYEPSGDQPQAIEKLSNSVIHGNRAQTLHGVTGSGKTFTMANMISRVNKPTLIISHNKTLAAQLFSEFKQFFPHNAVEYFVSYFDYYQPEAYVPQTDTYIEKDSAINDEIERLRLSATSSLSSRRDVIVVASVSCIYGLGSKVDYEEMVVPLKIGQAWGRDQVLAKLVDILYERNDYEFERGRFRVRGDTIEVHPAYTETALRIEFFGNEIDRITLFEPLTGKTLEQLGEIMIFPARHFVTPYHKIERAIRSIKTELDERIIWFESQGKLLEAQRLKMRTMYDIEMMVEMGFCSGIENYSRHLTGRAPGEKPYTLLDFFPEDYLMIIDESHATVPQIGGMYAGDRSRKMVLVEHGFRLPSALDNRPLNSQEFDAMIHQVLYVSATPAPFELQRSAVVAEQIVRPTGLLDPQISVRPLKGQVDDLLGEIRLKAEKKERVLVTTLTKRTAEDLSDYLKDLGVRVQYLHSEIDTIERVEILRALRAGDFDVLIGINLLREGLDLPEVSLVAILDGDKEGFLRSETSLIQTAGRAARHINGQVIVYCDVLTDSIKRLIAITEYRRQKQIEYNRIHNITPQSVVRAVQESLHVYEVARKKEESIIRETGRDYNVVEVIRELEEEMQEASRNLEFERAALLRDQILELKQSEGHQKTGLPSISESIKKISYGKSRAHRGSKKLRK